MVKEVSKKRFTTKADRSVTVEGKIIPPFRVTSGR